VSWRMFTGSQHVNLMSGGAKAVRVVRV